MATLTVEITDASKQLIDEQVASGRFQDAGALFEMLLSRASWLKQNDVVDQLTDAERKRIDQMLLESEDAYERGEYVVHKPGDIRQRFDAMKRQRNGAKEP